MVVNTWWRRWCRVVDDHNWLWSGLLELLLNWLLKLLLEWLLERLLKLLLKWLLHFKLRLGTGGR